MVLEGIKRFKFISQKRNKGNLQIADEVVAKEIDLSQYVKAEKIENMVALMNDGPINFAKDLGRCGDSGQKTNYHKFVSKLLGQGKFTKAFHSACLFETKENILSIISKHGQDIDFDVVPAGRSSWMELCSLNKNKINDEEIKAHIPNMEKCPVLGKGVMS